MFISYTRLLSHHMKSLPPSQNIYANISRILTVAQRLCDAGHYAAPSIRLQASKLDRDWRTFATALEDRNTVLALSVLFHKKTEEVGERERDRERERERDRETERETVLGWSLYLIGSEHSRMWRLIYSLSGIGLPVVGRSCKWLSTDLSVDYDFAFNGSQELNINTHHTFITKVTKYEEQVNITIHNNYSASSLKKSYQHKQFACLS